MEGALFTPGTSVCSVRRIRLPNVHLIETYIILYIFFSLDLNQFEFLYTKDREFKLSNIIIRKICQL